MAPTTRRSRAATSRHVGQPSTCERIASPSSGVRAPRTHAATELSSSSWSDIDRASTAEIRTHLLERQPHTAREGAERLLRHNGELAARLGAEVGLLDD